MNNNVNMAAAMNAMGGQVGGGMPMMNNGLPPGVNAGPRPVPLNDNQNRSQLNTYIYEYFLRNEMYDCARAIINSEQPINVMKNSPGRRRDGNPLDNGVSPDGMDGDLKDEDTKRPADLPLPNIPEECPESCFLYEWWCLFWDMFNAQRGKGDSRNVLQYAAITQQQSRFKQESQANMIRQMRPDVYGQMMMRNQQNGMGQNDIARKAMQNNRSNMTPQQIQMFQQQQQQQQQQNQKQQQMQRDGSDGDGNRQQRPQSPGSAENAPSPSKRPRLEGPPFNGQQGMAPNGRGQPQVIPGQQVGAGPPNNVAQNNQMLLTNGINPGNLTGPQFQNFPGQGQIPGQPNAKSLQAYTNNLVQHQQSQMPNKGMPTPGGPQGQGSPMMNQGQDGGAIANYYNAGGDIGPNGMRPGPNGQPGSGGNHALQDYQMQLMLLEQQNKKRLMMARQEQDSMALPRDGSGGPGMGPNGQPFQGTSPQGQRTGTSPNPNDQMKRGTPQMNTAGIPSPLPEGQSRGSPSAMNFMPNQMDPNMAPHFYTKINGMDGMGVLPNGMRPPSSHPAAFNGQMNQQAMNMARQQQAGQIPGWQAGPNGAPMMQQASQGPVPQAMTTPQQRNMPPPAAPAAGANANGRTQPSSPQQAAAPPTPSQGNKANPGKGKKDTKTKRNAKKGAAIGATPANDGPAEPATPTPATPITPSHPLSFNKNGQNSGQLANGQSSTAAVAPAPAIAPPQPDPIQNGSFSMDDGSLFNINGMDFTNPTMGNGDVLQDFDFDSFLHQDGGDNDAFAFDASTFSMEGGEIGAD